MPVRLTPILAVVVAGAVFALLYVMMYRPLTRWRAELVADAETLREQLSEGPKLRREHAVLKRQLNDLLERVQEVNRRIPDESREGEFLADLSRLAQEHRVEIIDFRRGAVVEAETHSAVSVEVTGRGAYADVCRLLNAIAHLPRLAELTELEIEADPTADTLPCSLSYALYYGMASPDA